MVLFREAFHRSHEGLDLPLQCGGLRWLVSLKVVGGSHRASEYYATLCLRSESMANLLFPQTAPTDDAVNITSEPHDLRTLVMIPAQQREKT